MRSRYAALRDETMMERHCIRMLTGLGTVFLLGTLGGTVGVKGVEAQKLTPSVQEKPQLAKLSGDSGLVTVRGVWRPDNLTKENEPIEADTELSCYRHGGKNLVGTDAFCLQASASAPEGKLYVATQFLKVVEWSDSQIIATDDSAICLTSQTIFDLKRKTVIALDIRKPEARGVFDVCKKLPDRQTYYLQDEVNYWVQKDLGTLAKPR